MEREKIFIEEKLLPPLTKEELSMCIKQAKLGSKTAREKVILHNIRLVIQQVIKKFSYTSYEKKELVSVGLIGLIKAVDTFEVTKNIEFSSYAGRCIQNEILMFIRKGKKHTSNESLNKVVSIDNNGNELVLEDVLIDPEVDIEAEFLQSELLIKLRQQVANLNEQQKEIIKLYFGFYNNKRYSQKEIAFILGSTQPNISKTITKIVKRISTAIKNENLIDKLGEHKKTSLINSLTPTQNSDELMINKVKLIYDYFNKYIYDYLNKTNTFENKLTKVECLEILTFIKTKEFASILAVLPPKETILIAWKLGYLNGENFSVKSLANFLIIDEPKINEIITSGLLIYKDSLSKISTNENISHKKLIK